MKVIFVCGSHPRHCYIAKNLFEANMLAGIIIEEREEFTPSPPDGLKNIDRENFIRHFKKRNEAENKFFSNVNINAILKETPHLKTDIEQLNGPATIDFINKINADFLFSYGCHMLSEEIINAYENRCFNIHGGLSPWFKGVITLYWPFYFLKPNWAGMTIHRLSTRLDAGDILHHSVPLLEKGDGVHDVACKAVLKVGKDIIEILNLIENGKKIFCVPQKSNGKLFTSGDWTPQHLRLIYNTFSDDIVDCFLNGEIASPDPDLVNFISAAPVTQ